MIGVCSDAYAGDKVLLISLLEEAAVQADEMNLWFNGQSAKEQFQEIIEHLTRVIQNEASR